MLAGVMLGNEGVVLEQVEGLHNFGFKVNPGLGSPYGGPWQSIFGSVGKRKTRGSYKFFGTKKFTPNTITSQKQLLAEIEEVAQLGYGVDREEEMEGQVCVGSAVLNRSSRVSRGNLVGGPSKSTSRK